MKGTVRRLAAVAGGCILLALCLAASAAASAPPAVTGLGSFGSGTLPQVTPGMLAGQKPLVHVGLQAKGARLAKQLGISSNAAQKAATRKLARTAAASGPSTQDFLGYVYYDWGFAAVYDGIFFSGGYEWYYQVYYFYDYVGDYLGYGFDLWYYYFGWWYDGWFCCY